MAVASVGAVFYPRAARVMIWRRQFVGAGRQVEERQHPRGVVYKSCRARRNSVPWLTQEADTRIHNHAVVGISDVLR